jgi:hypothetical protein
MNGRLGRAALELVGVPFRLHGRDPAVGLDCVGVVAQALRRIGCLTFVPEGYTLRGTAISPFISCAEQSGLEPTDADGDVILCMVNPVQPHLLVSVNGGFVHAHASLRRVTFMPSPLPWPIAMQWRVADFE